MVQGILLFSLPFACGICFFLHSATLQGSIALRYLSFRSNHQSAKTSATHANVVPSFHFVHPSRVPLRPNFGFHPSTIHTSQNIGASFHPAPFTSLHSLATLAFPPHSSGMLCLLLTPEKKESILVSTLSNGYFFYLIFRPKKLNLTSLETNIFIVIATKIPVKA